MGSTNLRNLITTAPKQGFSNAFWRDQKNRPLILATQALLSKDLRKILPQKTLHCGFELRKKCFHASFNTKYLNIKLETILIAHAVLVAPKLIHSFLPSTRRGDPV